MNTTRLFAAILTAALTLPTASIAQTYVQSVPYGYSIQPSGQRTVVIRRVIRPQTTTPHRVISGQRYVRTSAGTVVPVTTQRRVIVRRVVPTRRVAASNVTYRSAPQTVVQTRHAQPTTYNCVQRPAAYAQQSIHYAAPVCTYPVTPTYTEVATPTYTQVATPTYTQAAAAPVQYSAPVVAAPAAPVAPVALPGGLKGAAVPLLAAAGVGAVVAIALVGDDDDNGIVDLVSVGTRETVGGGTNTGSTTATTGTR